MWSHTLWHTFTGEMKPIRGGLWGGPALSIDPDTGPLASKRFTAGDIIC